MGSNRLDLEDLMWNKRKYNDWNVYAGSKLANIYFTKHMVKVLEQQGASHVKVCSLHPGVVRTELGRNMNKCGLLLQVIFCGPCFCLFTKSPHQGTQTQLHCSLMPWE